MTRDEINAFGAAIQSHLLDGDQAIILDVGARSADVDCDLASCTATVAGYVGKTQERFTGHAVYLHDAILLARGKLRYARDRHAAALVEAKKKAAA